MEENIENALLEPRTFHNELQKVEWRILWTQVIKCLECHPSASCLKRDLAIFYLYFRQGFTAQAISRVPNIGLTVKGVESTLFRLTRLLKAKLNPSSNSSQPNALPNISAGGN